MRPSSNHGTLRLPNDDADDDDNYSYTLPKSVRPSYQTAGHNSCSIVSGDVSKVRID